MKVDGDLIQRIKVCGIFFLQSYKILTGTMLAVFVPQSCGDHVCTLTENINNEDFYHRSALGMNSLTMLLFFGYYLIELRREEWSIKYLDIDNNKPDNSLKAIIITEPKLDKQMDRLNKYYYNALLITGFFYFVNVLMTIKLLKDKYHSSSTISCFMSFSLLVMMKLYNSFSTARQSVKNDKMMSAYMSEFVSYNVLDADYLEKKGNKLIVNRP
jgi:hypothetical protein|tara:strand:- start:121 stop:762 length:642 start_codon:yes stop_codon:yes gene_type:complete